MFQDYQVDWEALLQQSPAQFIASLSSWLLPGEALAKPREAAAAAAETIASNDKLTSQTESSLESVRDGSQRTEQDGAASSAEVRPMTLLPSPFFLCYHHCIQSLTKPSSYRPERPHNRL